MSKFTDTVKRDTPRLVVMFRRDGNEEMFQWGVVGKIPILTLIGYITRVQVELVQRDGFGLSTCGAEECPESALVVTYDEIRIRCEWFVHPDIPVDSLVGMLETIKSTIVSTHLARQVAAQQVRILGADGQPIQR